MTAFYSCDWFEIYCDMSRDSVCHKFVNRVIEHPLGALSLSLMPYGTRVYSKIWRVSIPGTKPEEWIEFCTITCDPLSKRSEGGIMSDFMCHLKLSNYWCYCPDIAQRMLTHVSGLLCIKPIRASRMDFCCDFQYARNGLYAANLMAGIVHRKYVKVHQPKWAMHGVDTDERLYINSLSFGSKQSAVFTRFYNKSLELKESGKVYIVEAWKNANFKSGVDIYRVEFSLHDCGLRSVDKQTGAIIEVDWQQALSPTYVETMFLYLCSSYFDIRKSDNSRKYRCTPLDLFERSDMDYKSYQNPRYAVSTRTTRLVSNYLRSHAAELVSTPAQFQALSEALYNLLFDQRTLSIYERNIERFST